MPNSVAVRSDVNNSARTLVLTDPVSAQSDNTKRSLLRISLGLCDLVQL